MKKSLLTLAFTAIGGLSAFAQGYYYFKNVGAPKGYTYQAPSTGVTTILAGSATPQSSTLSTAQNLPFAFNFFGFSVSQFKASTSGYITFDVSQTVDIATNTVLPSAAAPKMAIFAFWDSTKVQTVGTSSLPAGIRSWITGTAPNRVFHIQWQTAQGLPDNGTDINAAFYAILINENGTFDLVQDFGLGTFTATMGVNNIDGTVGKMIDGSPAMNYGGNANSYLAESAVFYNFKYGVQPALDLKLTGELTPQVAGAVNGVKIKVKTINYGSSDVASAKMSYSINNGTAVTAPTNTAVAKNAGRATIEHPTSYIPLDADANTTKTIRVWFSEINGGSSVF
jgi:hypothetical protein